MLLSDTHSCPNWVIPIRPHPSNDDGYSVANESLSNDIKRLSNLLTATFHQLQYPEALQFYIHILQLQDPFYHSIYYSRAPNHGEGGFPYKNFTRSSCFPYTGCPRRNGQNFGRVFLVLKYTDITQNTYIQIWTVTEIMAREKCGLLWDSTHCTCQLTV
jgi:hypothetical protein